MAETTSAAGSSGGWNGPERRGPGRLDDEARARKLLADYQAGGSGAAAAREALVLQFRPLVQKQARQFFTSSCSAWKILVQEGFLGLIHGIDQYDPTRGVKLITYVTHHIDGHLRHYLRDRTQIIKEPAWLQEMAQKVRREAETLTQEMGREPTDAEVAGSLGIERVGSRPHPRHALHLRRAVIGRGAGKRCVSHPDRGKQRAGIPRRAAD